MTHESRPQRELHAPQNQLDFPFMHEGEQPPHEAAAETLRTVTRSIRDLETGDILLRDGAEWRLRYKTGGAASTTLTLESLAPGGEREHTLSLPNDTDLEVII
jgi:hypothetical protein